MNKIKLYCGFPSLTSRSAAQVVALRNLEKKYADFIEFIYPEQHVGRIFHDYARNCVVEEFLASSADILWFLDSDITPHESVLELVLKNDEWKCAGAPYPVFMKPAGYDYEQVIYTVWNSENGKYIPTEIPDEGVAMVDAIATGCIFIKREVIQALSKPYFEFKFNPETRELIEGEDLGFCKKVNALGIQFYIDFSKICDHVKEVSLIKVNNYAISRANNMVLALHRGIRQEVLKKTEAKSKLALSRPSLIVPK